MASTRPDLAIELYAEIALYLSKGDLVSLGRASPKLNGVANRALYARIVLDAPSSDPVTTLLRALRDKKALSDLPRHMELHWTLEKRGQPKLPASLLATTLPTLTNLTYFSVSPSLGKHTRAFDKVVMPCLVQFHSYGSGRISTVFLDRHPKLTHLTLCQNMPLRCQLKRASEGLVYLRISYRWVAEELLQRLSHPKLQRVVFGRYIPIKVIVSCMESYPKTTLHLDMRWAYGDWMVGPGAAPAPPAPRVTSLSVSLCEFISDPPSIRGSLRLFCTLLFPNVATLAIHCCDSGHHHEHSASAAFAVFVQALNDEVGLRHVQIAEFLGFPVMGAFRDGDWRWACVPEENRDTKEYRVIPWPEL